MNVNITTHLDVEAVLAARGLGRSDMARVRMAEEVAKFCDPYVPMSAGSGAHMKEQYTIAPDGSTITYRGPYAHYQYEGEVMVGVDSGSPWAKSGEPKRGTGRGLEYHGAPMRGKQWDKRMMADRGDDVKRSVAKFVRGKVK